MLSNAFFLGKGGVGKTTLSAAFALDLARSGKRVLIASLDPAHNLGDVYGVALGDRPTGVERGLDALEVDLGAWVDRYLEESRSELKATYAYAGTLNLDRFFDIMKYSPGTEEYAVLWAIEHIHCELSAEYDVVVFDTPPTALSLRFLAMPAISRLWIAELSKLRERILEKRQSITRINPASPVASSCVDKADDKVYGRLGAIRERLAGLQGLFGKESYVAVVINPDQLSVSEALRIKEELDRIEVPLSGLCVNKRGVSAAEWSLDSRLSETPAFDFDFLPGGLRDREDLRTIDCGSLVADFMATAPEGTL
ncbi:MAG: ArsA family ATPase [Spirochaetes bacterium]|nr:ArsA family ATPase [Spirochaetota bacterium]MBU1079676.1 ArsA family ATPase [Spirochaetota bacterium]